MSFSPEWLALREPVDHHSRDAALAARVSAHFSKRTLMRIVDLGCGTGSNLRGSYKLYARRQEWLLIDNDVNLLIAARKTLTDWADRARPDDGYIQIVKDDYDLTIRFGKADLVADLSKVMAGGPDLVTAAALFDLASPAWMAEVARHLKAQGSAFYTSLTYNGQDAFSPAHPRDGDMVAAFKAHQQQDKGFGVAAGPESAQVLKDALIAAGLTVSEGDSPWRLGPQEAVLAGQLLNGMAAAVKETGRMPADDVDGWLAFRRAHLTSDNAMHVTGHTDTFAVS